MMGKDNRTTERKVFETAVQMPMQVRIGKKNYTVARPSVATLMAFSAAISTLPDIKVGENTLVTSALREAKDFRAIGEAVATLIVGARGLNSMNPLRRRLKRARIRRTSELLLEFSTSEELLKAAYQLLSIQDVSSFFALTAFLTGANMTKATKAETTASGRQ